MEPALSGPRNLVLSLKVLSLTAVEVFLTAFSNRRWHFHSYEPGREWAEPWITYCWNIQYYIQVLLWSPAETTRIFTAALNKHNTFHYQRKRPSSASLLREELNIEWSGIVRRKVFQSTTKWKNTINSSGAKQNKSIMKNEYRNLISEWPLVSRIAFCGHRQMVLSKCLFSKNAVN